MQRISWRGWCIFGFLAVILWIGVGCGTTGKKTREGAKKPPTVGGPKVRYSPGAPSCSYRTDDADNPIVDLNQCTTLQNDSSVIVLLKTAFKRPIFLVHITDQLFYAWDSRCTQDTCLVKLEDGIFVCTCDKSRYALSGEVISGPATKPLRELLSLKNGPLIRVTLP